MAVDESAKAEPTKKAVALATTQHALTGKLAKGATNVGSALGGLKAGLGVLKLIDTPITAYNALASGSNHLSDLYDQQRGYDPETHTQKQLSPEYLNNPLNKHNFGLRLPMAPTIVGSAIKQIPALNPSGDRNIFHNKDFIDEFAEGVNGAGKFIANGTNAFLNRYPQFRPRF